jgi:hypothetical protein
MIEQLDAALKLGSTQVVELRAGESSQPGQLTPNDEPGYGLILSIGPCRMAKRGITSVMCIFSWFRITLSG